MITSTGLVIPKLSAFVDGVPMDTAVWDQVKRLNDLPFVRSLALMPDAHVGKGSTVGSVIGTVKAIIPAAVGVDIGCGMTAVKLNLTASDLPESLVDLRRSIEDHVPVGGPGVKGSWQDPTYREPGSIYEAWDALAGSQYEEIIAKYPKIGQGMTYEQLGTLGTGNHFIEICLDTEQNVWIMLHSGSRGLGNRVGSFFIERAKEEMRRWFINIPDQDLAYLPEGSQYYSDYIKAVSFAQKFAFVNRKLMLDAVIYAVECATKQTIIHEQAVSCHHNYISMENHFGTDMWVTRKGAVRARVGDLGIIPGSMGAKSFIVRGLGHEDSLMSCSHGAGRVMSRTEAKRRISVADHVKATEGVECRKDADMVDESPAAYKPIEAVMEAQKDLVEIVAELRQVLCVKG